MLLLGYRQILHGIQGAYQSLLFTVALDMQECSLYERVPLMLPLISFSSFHVLLYLVTLYAYSLTYSCSVFSTRV
jgi:hypothetical protein